MVAHERLTTTNAGLAAARRRRGGRPPKLRPDQQQAVLDAVLFGQATAASLARRFRVSEATVSRLLASHRRAEQAEEAAPAEADASGKRAAGVLPLTALDQRVAVVGTSGSGKTYAAKGLLEPVLQAGGRVCVVDPLGVWWGLARDADAGGPPPFPVAVFGGAHADVPLHSAAGTALGHLVATERLACVVDLSEFGTAKARRAFMTAFTAALYAHNTEPLHLVLDEADLWAPQRVPAEGVELLRCVEEIVRRGRIRGFVPWLITQRPAVLHKDVLSQADILVAMKLTASQDRDAIGGWIEGQADRAEGRRILGALPRLRLGEGWVWAPGEGVLRPARFPRIRTLDTSATPRGPLRRADVPAPALTSPDPKALGTALAKLAALASGEAADMGEDGDAAAAAVRRLERDLAAAHLQLAALEAELAALRAKPTADRLR